MAGTVDGEVALVTGASRGIGQAIATTLAGEGAQVVGTATTAGGAERIDEHLKARGGAGLVLDVTDTSSIEQVLETIRNRFGPVSVLVNNAGITRDGLFMRMSDEDWDAVLDTNLSSVFRVTKALVRDMMKARRGRVINISSVVGLTGNPGQANYAAAKAGMLGLTRTLARELGPRGITVNAVAPGFIDTDMTRSLTEEQQQDILRQVPLNRLGQADDIAEAVAFLASPKAAYITGETLNVNGGIFTA